MVIPAFVACSVMASIAGLFLAAEVRIGTPIIGNQALESIAAGRARRRQPRRRPRSFVGAMLAALFLTLIDNILPLFHQPTEYAEMTIGVLILARARALPGAGAPGAAAARPGCPSGAGGRGKARHRRDQRELVSVNQL